MDPSSPEVLKDPGGELALPADWGNSESFCPEKEQKRCSSWTETEDGSINGFLSQSSISRSLHRAEVLFKNTFNPRWLFHGRADDEEEEHFVVAYNLVSRSSARLLRLQQALLMMSPQWQLVGGAQTTPVQACIKGPPGEAAVLFLPSSCCLQGHYRALCTLLDQRCCLVFVHEFSRRARLAAAFITRVTRLLELNNPTPNQMPSSCSPFRLGLGLLSQELRVHLNHWSCLFSKVQSDHRLRCSLLQQTGLLLQVKQTLDLLGLQALVLMERYVYVVLSAVAHAEPDSVPGEVLEEVLAGAKLYNQAVEEQRVQHSATQLRTTVLQEAHYLDPGLPQVRRYHPSAFSVKEIMSMLAVRPAVAAAKQLQSWTSEQSHEACTCSDQCMSPASCLRCGSSALKSDLTWDQLQNAHMSSPRCINHSTLQLSFCHSCSRTVCVPELHLDTTLMENCRPVLDKPRKEGPEQDQNQTYVSHPGLTRRNVEDLDSVEPNGERRSQFKSCFPSPSPVHRLTATPPPKLDHSSVQVLFQVFSSTSSDLLAQVASQTPPSEGPADQNLPATTPAVFNGKEDWRSLCDPVINTTDPVNQNKDQNVERPQKKCDERETSRPDAPESSGFQRNGDSEKEDFPGAEGSTVKPECVHWPHSVQWSDVGQSLVFADLLDQFDAVLWTLCSKALWLQLHGSHESSAAESINLQGNRRTAHILHRIGQASASGLVPKEYKAMLEDISLHLLIITAHAQWDYEVCRSLGSSIKDQCLANQGTDFVMTTSQHDGSLLTSQTMENFLLLPPPLLSSLSCHQVYSRTSGPLSSSRSSLQRRTVSLVLASVQMSTVWVVSKAFQFLSSWSLQKFLLITQGDLKMVKESLEMMVHQTKCLLMDSESRHHSSFWNHNQLLLEQQTEALDGAESELQTFSSLLLKTFSTDCKRMSGEIFERTMPSAVHWRPSSRTDFPSSPSEYASLAAQTVIGQVLEGVAPLSDDARVQALSITMTAFMEAWMEHILKQKIKFSIHGALQLKQDFDSIRDMIQSDRYGLSSDLHQRLLGLRVFQQVDSAVVCLLQQPQAKLYLQPRAWEPFRRCCPANSSRESIDASVSSSITNLRCVDGEDAETTQLPPLDPPPPTEPYLAPSAALGAAQQEWLDLRIQSGARRWRLPGLQCVSKSEP